MKTPQLYDEGEEFWKLKIHAGNGGIYLSDSGTGYVNIDTTGKFARAFPKLTERNRTLITDYYARLEGDLNNLPKSREIVVDQITNFSTLPYGTNSVSKIVCVQALEHLTPVEIDETLLRWWNILKFDGVLIISIPDMDGTLEMLKDWDTQDFAHRHLRGSMKNQWLVHKSWFNKDSFHQVLQKHHFGQIEFLENIHCYPAIVVKCRKIDSSMGYDRQYAFPLPEYNPLTCKTVLDVGPGKYPLSFATHCVDVNDEYQASRTVPCTIANVENLPFANKSWDFVNSSHCVEHTEHPAQAIAELQRVGKRGYIETPNAMMDYFCQHGKTHPKWMILPIENGFVFVEKTPKMNTGFSNDTIGAFIHRVIHYPITFSEIERDLRYHFWKHHSDGMNVKASWNEHKSIQCYEFRLNGKMIVGNGINWK